MIPLLAPLRFLAKALAAEDSPRRLAWGFALGALAGLIPKTSLLAHLALVVMSAAQVNLAAGWLAAGVFSLLSPLADPLTHRLGRLLLVDAGALAPAWTALYNLPGAPWTGFNNTVVLGSTLLGAGLLYPLARFSEPLFARWRTAYGERIRRLKVVQLLLGAELGGKAAG